MDNEDAARYLSEFEEWSNSPSAQAAIEQAQAQFMHDIYVVMSFTHAAALASLRGNTFVQALASTQLAHVIREYDEEQTRLMIMKMAAAIVSMQADLSHNGDLEASVAAQEGGPGFLRLETYVATNGAICLFCGEPTKDGQAQINGWHECGPSEPE